MKKRNAIIAMMCALVMVGAFALSSCSPSGPATGKQVVRLKVFAPISLSGAVSEAQVLYNKENPDVVFVDTQFKNSSELNAMLEGGAYADLEITASKSTMDEAEEKGLINKDTRTAMLRNELVIVAANWNEDITAVTLEDVATGSYTVCVGSDNVAAGIYANQSLSTIGCFNDPNGRVGAEAVGKADGTEAYAGTPIEDKVVIAESVDDVCTNVTNGNVDIAIVYRSDAERFSGTKVVGVISANTHKNVIYSGAVCARSVIVGASKAFLDWCLTDKDAIAIWRKWGFELVA